MTQQVKNSLRTSFLRPVYLWFANRYRGVKRLFSYPTTANVHVNEQGAVDYDEYWDYKLADTIGKLSAWRLKRAQAFSTIVSANDRVLDIGVGDGALLQYLVDAQAIDAYGIDISAKVVEFCHKIGLTNVVLGDANRPIGEVISENFGENVQFDYVILSEIIEHLPNPEKLLLDLRPYIRKGFIISIPNTGFHQHRLRLLLGRFPLQWIVTPGEHLRFWTLADFRWWAKQLGFRIEREIPYEGTKLLRQAYPSLFAAAFVYLLSNKE